MWLEKISLIPKAEYEFIGSGGYAKVYKIKIQTELFAVKIVRGVGKFSDYETQVRALEKEYGLVTSIAITRESLNLSQMPEKYN